MNVFVHVLRSAPDSHNLAVMFAPAGPTGTGGSLSPHYVREPQLIALLEGRGVAHSVATKIASDLQKNQSVSELTTIPSEP